MPSIAEDATLCNMSRKKHNPNPAGKEGQPVSLYPLSFKEAMAGLAQVKPPDKKKPGKSK
jgi:hypothetical protein